MFYFTGLTALQIALLTHRLPSDTREGHDCTQTVRLMIMHEADTDLGVNLHFFLTYEYIMKKKLTSYIFLSFLCYYSTTCFM